MNASRLALCAVLLLGVVFGLHRIAEPDLFQQIAVGRAILADPSSIGMSSFHHTVPDHPYVADKWLASALVALLERLGGERALMLYQVLLSTLFAAACFFSFRKWGASPLLALLGISLALAACAFRLEPRPETISLALVAFLIGLVRSSLPHHHLLWAVPAIFVLWVNVHGYFVVGLLVLAAAIPIFTLRRGLPLLGLAMLGCLVHPQGYRALVWPVRQLWILREQPYLREAIQEFQPTLTLLEGAGAWRWALLAATVLAAVSIAIVARGRRTGLRVMAGILFALPWILVPPPFLSAWPYRISVALWVAALFEAAALLRRRRWPGPLIFLGFTLLGLPLIRNLSLVPIGALLLLAPAWSRALDPDPDATERAARWKPVLASLLATAALLLVGWARLADRLPPGGERTPGWTGRGVDRDLLPVGAADFVESEKLPGPLLNHFDNGGYLLYRFHPARRVFISGNTSMYPGEFFREFHREVIGRDADPERIASRYGVRTAVLSHASPESSILATKLAGSPRWVLVYFDRGAAVFVYADDESGEPLRPPTVDLETRAAELLAESRAASPLPSWLAPRRRIYPDLNLGLFLRAVGRSDLALAEADRLWQAGPDVRLATFTAAACEEQGALPRSIPRLEWAYEEDAGRPGVRSWLSRALYVRAVMALEQGDLGGASADLERVLSLSPEEAGPRLVMARVKLDEGDMSSATRWLVEALELDEDGAIRRAIESDPSLSVLLPDSFTEFTQDPKN